MIAEQVDVVVVGGGVMGSSAAWQAASRGSDVVLLERFAEGHDQGASHGATRNFNLAYDEDDYVALGLEAQGLWDRLTEETGATVLDLVGLVNHGWVEPLRAVRRTHEAHGVASEFLSPREAGDRWPGMRFRSDVLYVPGSGRVRASDSLRALRAAAEAQGARFSYSTPVVGIEVRGEDEVVVSTENHEYRARRVIVAAGAWTAKLLGDLLPLPPFVITQEQPAHFAPRDPSLEWPSFNHSPDPDERADDYWLSQTYGLLSPGEGVKIGWHGVGPVTDPDQRTFVADPAQHAVLQRYVTDWMPGLDPHEFDPISCTYTTTESTDFVLDRVGPIVVAAGFSGHGFKFAPAIGRVLVDLSDGIPAPARFRGLVSR